MTTIELSSLSTEQLEAALKAKKDQEKKEREERRKAYEVHKDKLVVSLVDNADYYHRELLEFKMLATKRLNAFYERLKEYGDIPESNKGSFSIQNAEGTKKVEYNRNAVFGFDERSVAAEAKLKEWLGATIKKRDKETYDLIMGLLDKSKNDEYDPRNIAKLYKFENRFDHPLFQEAIALFKESYREMSTNFYIRFFEKDGEGKWQNVQLNWSAINAHKS